MQTQTTTQPHTKAEELTSIQKGHAFENFIVTLFNKKKFRLIEWRSDKSATNGVYPLSNMWPDLEFDYRGKRYTRFAVECKWKKNLYNGKFPWADYNKIQRYLNYQHQNAITVLVAIGLGGDPSNPDQLFITPLDHIKMYSDVFLSHLIPYKRNPTNSIESAEQLSLFIS